jgi:hypothetical protein
MIGKQRSINRRVPLAVLVLFLAALPDVSAQGPGPRRIAAIAIGIEKDTRGAIPFCWEAVADANRIARWFQTQEPRR